MSYAICNETFEGWEHQRVCEFISRLGYSGLEVAPFTLSSTPTTWPAADRLHFRNTAELAGIQIIGLHWLLAKTTGLHLTHPHAAVRQATAQYLVDLGKLCHDLGGSLMVLGSPQQRNRLPDVSPAQAFEYALDTLRQAMPRLGEYGIRLCLEPLGTAETNFMNTCAEGLQLVKAVDHPLCVLHLDVKAMAAECDTMDDGLAIARLISEYASYAGHFHANDPNRRGPGFGAMAYRPIMKALKEARYAGWVSVEVFDYSPDPETIARDSLRNMQTAAGQQA
jgi:sugar phosphate isomerase/epimerase